MLATARAERDKVAGVVALTMTVEVDTGEVLEEPQVLARYGEVSREFQEGLASVSMSLNDKLSA